MKHQVRKEDGIKMKKQDVEFVNLTPHEITIIQGDDECKIQPSGSLARLRYNVNKKTKIGGFKLVEFDNEVITGIPKPEDNKVFIVSSVIMQALRTNGLLRSDIVSPDTSRYSAIRDKNGNIIAVRGFQTYTSKT